MTKKDLEEIKKLLIDLEQHIVFCETFVGNNSKAMMPMISIKCKARQIERKIDEVIEDEYRKEI